MNPTVIKGNHHQDERGIIRFNNGFDVLGIKRVYLIENTDVGFVRAWHGHQVEQRWFSPVKGVFKIKLIKIDDWNKLSPNLPVLEFTLHSENLDVLHIPPGFVTSIQASEDDSQLMVFADYRLAEIQDEYSFPPDYFKL
ncbi:WxcM-like domain-containing protein [Chryseobacterium sp. MDT2-18]|uniref:WxcM-like domain-containing protein n=1 Tax=Chryseobacterium sp. MDT2-18 TaxID=1259136 RepID=UPI00278A3684|nr:WxcM-like domain-containing protein [Chryseobacterium sp. MDT2-18]MDQ0476840.1 dTDP-4-dehydrorhamnose 3,5-epimerase-like enzyme [Chryseobacterium sp. MDT2-18]